MAASPEQPSLTVLGGPLSGQRLLFDQTVDGAVIGSDASCSFRIDAPGVSPIHARVRYEEGGLIVFDTQSPRGLYINDDRVETQAALRNGDILWLGKPGEEGVVMIQCRIPSRPAVAVAAPAATGINSSSPAVVLDADMVDTVIEPNLETSAGADAFFGESDADATVGTHDADSIETRAIPPSERRYDDDELPRTLHVEPPPRAAAPSDFEDETAETALPAEPEPEPELPATVINVPAPTIAMSPPPPPRATTPTPVPRPTARPTPPPAAYPPPRPASSPKPKAPVAAPRPSRSSGGGGGAGKIIAAAAAVVVLGGGAVGAFLFWKSRSGPGALPRSAPTAATVAPTAAVVTPGTASSATAEPAVSSSPEPIEEVVTVVSKTPTPAPRASQQVALATTQVQPSVKPSRAAGGTVTAAPPTAPPAGAQAAALKAQAEAAFAAGQYDAAISHYDEAQKLAPSDELLVGKTRAQVARDSMRRRFSAGVTTASGKAAGGSISGFESSDVKVAKALDYSGRIEFEVTPEHVRPGVNYTIKILLTNDGKKKWQVSGVTGTTVANGQRAANTVPTTAREIEPQAKVPLGEISGVWPEGVNSWYLELVVSSSRGDSFKSLLTWK